MQAFSAVNRHFLPSLNSHEFWPAYPTDSARRLLAAPIEAYHSLSSGIYVERIDVACRPVREKRAGLVAPQSAGTALSEALYKPAVPDAAAPGRAAAAAQCPLGPCAAPAQRHLWQ